MPDALTIVVFDIDGTLLHSVGQHQAALLDAYLELGIEIGDRELSEFPDHTDSAIYDLLLFEQRGESASADELRELDVVLEHHYLGQTRRDQPMAVTGARTLLADLETDDRLDVVFATGSMRRVARHKLTQLGVDADRSPLATASERLTREEIVASAIELVAGPISVPPRVISIGDGLWDLRAADALGLPFVAVESGTHIFDAGPVRSVADLGSLTADELVRLAGETRFPLSTPNT
jgi:phosphoglycolate phosphatase-like HAD superfamily hydrolase